MDNNCSPVPCPALCTYTGERIIPDQTQTLVLARRTTAYVGDIYSKE